MGQFMGIWVAWVLNQVLNFYEGSLVVDHKKKISKLGFGP